MALVIYDLDDTLLNEDCSRLWLRFLMDQGLADADILQQEARLDEDYRRGTLDMNDYLLMQLGPHIGSSLQQATTEVDLFIRQYIEPHIRPSALENIRQHQANGDRCLVVSASVRFLVAPIANYLGIEDAIGVEIELDNEIITGKADGVICYQEGKVIRLNEWLEINGESLEGSWFYSDSHNDLPLLNKVCNPVAVSPDEKLRAVANDNGWSIYEWRIPASA